MVSNSQIRITVAYPVFYVLKIEFNVVARSFEYEMIKNFAYGIFFEYGLTELVMVCPK